MPAALAGLAAAQLVYGVIKGVSSEAKTKKLTSQRKAYQTPAEIGKILDATLSIQGGDTATRDFETSQINRSFGQMLGSATRLGADPNDLSVLFEDKINGLMKVGQEFHASNMDAFGKLISAFGTVADSKAAEWKSQQDILKDQIQAAVQGQKDAGQNVGNAINTLTGVYSAYKTGDLYNNKSSNKPNKPDQGSNAGGSAGGY